MPGVRLRYFRLLVRTGTGLPTSDAGARRLRPTATVAARCVAALVAGRSPAAASRTRERRDARPTSSARWTGAPAAAGAALLAGRRAGDGGPERVRAPARGAARLSGGGQQVGLVVRAVPARVPVLPEQVAEARQAGRLPRGRRRGRARGRRASSCASIPVPYPSFFDPDGEIARALAASAQLPRRRPSTTARGELVYTKQGGYASEAALADDVGRSTRSEQRRARSADNPGHDARRHLAVGAWPRWRSACAASPRGRRSSRPASATRWSIPVDLDLTINPASAALGRARPRRRRARRRRPGRSSGSTRPGGLDESMRDIVKDIIAAPMPVVVYVSPERRAGRVRGAVHHRGRRRRGDGARRPTSARRRRSRSAAASRTRCSAARCETTRPPTCARWPRATAATPTSPSRWCATRPT